MRIGQSVDRHRLEKGRKLIVGGVEIDHEYGQLGHSDGDALTHAVAEAILGALALGDLGKHFPDTDDKWKDINSLKILSEVVKLMDEKGYEIENVDCLIMIEKPKMAPYIETIRNNYAEVLHCSIDQISVKATRGEGLGFVGEEKGVEAHAVVLLKERG